MRKNPHQHPLLFLKGVKYAEIVSILNFMYHGEVNVTQDDLNGFLAVAEELKVKGLTQNDQNSNAGERSKPAPKSSREPPDIKDSPPAKRARVAQLPRNDDIQEITPPVPVKTEPITLSDIVSHSSTAEFTNQDQTSFANTLVAEPQEDESYDQEGYDYGYEEDTTAHFEPSPVSLNTSRPPDGNKEMVTYVMSQLEEGVDPNGKKMYSCKLCNFSNVKKEKVRQHVESWHGDSIGIRYKCDYCEKTYKCHSNLRTHVSTNHRQNFISTWT